MQGKYKTESIDQEGALLLLEMLIQHYEPGGGGTRSPRRGEARGSCHTPLEPSGPVHYGKNCEQKCTTT